jgi:hypothetical protein
LRAHLDQARGELGRGPQCGRLAPVRPGALLARSGRLRHEDHVHVAGVVQLPGAALAHGDHRQPARRGSGRQVRPGDRQGGFECRRRQVGQLGGHLVEGRLPGEVPGRQRQQPPPVRHPQRGHRIRTGSAMAGRDRHRLGVRRPRADRRQQFGAQLARFRYRERVATGQDPPVTGVPGEMIPERHTGAEHGRQPGAQPGLAVQRAHQLWVPGHPGQRGQREVGVRGGGQRVDQAIPRLPGIHGEIPGEQELRPGRVGEPQPGQPCGSGGPARHAHPSTVTARGAPRR